MNIKLTLLATVALALSFGAEGVLAFTTAHLIASRTSFHCYGGSSLKDFDSDGVLESTVNANRRNVLSKVAALLSMPTMFAFGLPAFADVSDGNALPEGAAQFSRVVRAKSDMIVSQMEVWCMVVGPHSMQFSFSSFMVFNHRQ